MDIYTFEYLYRDIDNLLDIQRLGYLRRDIDICRNIDNYVAISVWRRVLSAEISADTFTKRLPFATTNTG